jgi:hypothetical protein
VALPEDADEITLVKHGCYGYLVSMALAPSICSQLTILQIPLTTESIDHVCTATRKPMRVAALFHLGVTVGGVLPLQRGEESKPFHRFVSDLMVTLTWVS